jgi:hypothetical protein
MSELGILNAGDVTEQAIKLRDKGDFAGAQRLLQQNATDLEKTGAKYQDQRVIDRANKARQRANEISPAPAEWNIQRKKARRDISDDPLLGL